VTVRFSGKNLFRIARQTDRQAGRQAVSQSVRLSALREGRQVGR